MKSKFCSSSAEDKGVAMTHTKQELNTAAKHAAEYASDDLMHCHRGVLTWGKGRYVLFGNDGYSTDERSKKEAQAVCEAAHREGCPVSEIQTDRSGGTWAVAVVTVRKVAQNLLNVASATWVGESWKKAANARHCERTAGRGVNR
jgi:hypothetical protein